MKTDFEERLWVFAGLSVAIYFSFWALASALDSEHCTTYGYEHSHTTLTFDGYCKFEKVIFPAELASIEDK